LRPAGAPGLELVPASAADLPPAREALAKGVAKGFPQAGEGLAVLNEVLAQFLAVDRPVEWSQFWALDAASGLVVGLCGFKAPPRGGAVEIAYLTFPAFEGRGHATRMAAALSARALAAGQAVLAHTLPTRNASAALLRRCGFRFEGTVVDPDDGEVWRWSLRPAERDGPP